jgi:hypothetical protein
MSDLPQSPFLSADNHPLSAGRPPHLSPAPQAAAAELIPSSTGGHQGTSAASTVTVASGAADATDHIHEIFHFARQLCEDDHRFILDERAFMEAIEPLPMFLQGAAE